MKLRCIIVDDEPVARKVLLEYAGELDYLEVIGVAENGLKAADLLSREAIDLIFLDVNMPKLNGFDFLKSTGTNAMVILTTAYPEFAIKAFELHVLDYLLKPIAFERFVTACNRAKEYQALTTKPAPAATVDEGYFFIKCDAQIEKIYYDQLLYAEAMLNYVVLHTAERKLMVYVTIKALEEQLPTGLFIKVHKSYIINTTKVKSIEGGIINIGADKIPISQGLREQVMQQLVRKKLIKR